MFHNIPRLIGNTYDSNELLIPDPEDLEYAKLLTEINDSYALYELASKQEDFKSIERHISEVYNKIKTYISARQPKDEEDSSDEGHNEQTVIWRIRRTLLRRLEENVVALRECCRRIAFTVEQFRAKEAEEEKRNEEDLLL